ncbi:MAG TPA: cell division protein FtsQ/DivIB [Burkholderiales bacterium]|nr:cell division protein FtsQ/DivIB [Burkholderiales bacterium]
MAANFLIGLAALLFAFGGLQLLVHSPLFPLKEIALQGALKNVAAADIESAVEGIGGNFFAADLAGIRVRLEQVPWVRHVDLRRVWPDRIEVRLEEHVALARWGDTGLVNTFGEPFAATLPEGSETRLPVFAGPAGTEGELARRYRLFVELLAPLGEVPDRVVLTPRFAWQLHSQSGLNLELGRDGPELVEQRLARFVAAYPESLGRLPSRAVADDRFVDLRYPNGFALRVAGWKG